MLSNYRYCMLTADDQAALMRERLHQLEASHFKLTIELRLAGVVGDADNEVGAGAKVQLAAMEVQATALQEWLGMKEPADA
jgi:hypothetical protein